ncbi:MAG: penicillin-binding protein 2 [Stellaceae bacterium]
MPRDIHRRRVFTRRAAILAGGQGLLLAILGGRLYQLQIAEAARYKVLSEENRISLRLIAPPRGRILDRFGSALADNRHDYRVVIVAEEAGNVGATLTALSAVIAVTPQDRRRVLREVREKHPFVPVVVRAGLDWDELARVEIALPDLPGIAVEQGLIRRYPLGATAAHPVGYVAAVPPREAHGDPLLELPDFRVGRSGIEKAQDRVLRGVAGTREIEVNAFGRPVRALARVPPRAGADVVSTLDQAMQAFLVDRCGGEPSVASVLIDAPTGEVLALVSQPSFDPALFGAGLSAAAWRQLAGDPRHPLVDKAIAGIYPPGSTFKPVAAAAALSAGALTPQTRIFCPGYFRLGNAVFHCWKHGGHGTLTVRNAIKESCDVFFYETALRLGIDRLAAGAQKFGFGSPLGLDIPGEAAGLIPTPEWRRAAARPWQKGQTVIAGIGQGAVLATPLQIAVMAARLVTGRKIVPRLVRADGTTGAVAAGAFAPIAVDPAALALVRNGMDAVVNEPGGTGYALRIPLPGMAMGGKSGTSQVRRITAYQRAHGLTKPQDVPWRERDHALFVGFAPVEAPRYVCATVVEHGGFGAETAGPIVRDALLEVQKRDPARRLPAAGTVAAAPAADRAGG